MKARKHSNYTSMTEARREVSRESKNVQEKIFRQAVDDMYVQLIATVFWTMATRYGWGQGQTERTAGSSQRYKGPDGQAESAASSF